MSSISTSAARGFRTRSPVKQQAICQGLRAQIIDGTLPPGAQLPIRSELEKRFNVSSNTLQRALDRLIREGFIYAKGTAGTYVAEQPPHLTHYGVVLPHQRRTDPIRNRFLQAMVNEAERRDGDGGFRFRVYHVAEPIADDEEAQRLITHVRDHRLAGLLFLTTPDMFAGTPALEEAHPGRVVVNAGPSQPVPVVRFDWPNFLDRALGALAQRGCQRVALVGGTGVERRLGDAWRELARGYGMRTAAHWVQGVDLNEPAGADHLAQLLMYAGQAHRPDGLVIADDNLVEAATAGVQAAGVRAPDELAIIAHCNFPWPTPSVLPVQRLGFDARHVFQRCLDMIEQQRDDAGEPADVCVEAVFEQELHEANEPAPASLT